MILVPEPLLDPLTVVSRARQDLRALDARGLLDRVREGKANVWHPAADLTARLGS